MQEDRTSKWLASELRKRQEENPLPYELGAWEAFEAKRAASAKKKSAYWISGVAAALALLLVAGGIWIAADLGVSGDASPAGQLALQEEQAVEAPRQSEPRAAQLESDGKGESETGGEASGSDSESGKASIPANSSLGGKALASSADRNNSASKSKTDAGKTMPPAAKSSTETSPEQSRSAQNGALAMTGDSKETTAQGLKEADASQAGEARSGEAQAPTAPNQLQSQLAQATLPKEPELSDEEIKEILERKSAASIAMGVSPGFGASQSAEAATSGASLGLGVMVDMELTGKLVMGSGLAVNYLSQSSESQAYLPGAAFSAASSVTETNEISQVQLDIPLYFKYPITRNQSVSVQAGFSNLIIFSQGAEQQSYYTRQVAVMDAANADYFTLRSEAVSQSQDLNVPNQKFFPLATANLGVNIRVFESRKTSYEVMPFYNYPLQEFSGYGEKLGMFGASFKVNFGTIQKK